MRQLVLTVPADDVELASDALWALGVVAVEERRSGATVELWTSVGEVGEVDLPWPSRFVEVDDAVADTWRQFATPTWVEPDVVIRPAWVPLDAAGATVIVIEPGSTFGMGDHPTTRLTLQAARPWVTPTSRVLDVGCGSGVLAIGTMLFGASSAVGIDIAPAAVPVTLANAAANGVRVDVSTTDLADVDGEFDLVLANILAPALVALSADLQRVLAPGGALIVSGILAEAHQHVVDALLPLEPVAIDRIGDWVAITLR